MTVVIEQIADRYRHDVTGSAALASAGSREISVNHIAESLRAESMRAENPVGMANGTVCTTSTTVRTDAGARWLRSPKFGPHYHFQRWRSAT